MSKTLVVIAELAAAATAAAFGQYQLAVSFTLMAIGTELTPSAPKTDPTVTTSEKQPRPPRQTGYGRARLSGSYMLYDTATDGTSVDVLAVHDGMVDGFELFYLNDDRVTVRGDGWVEALSRQDGRYSTYDKIQILTRSGLATETAITGVASATMPNWGTDHRGDGVAHIALGCRTPLEKYFTTIYPNGLPTVTAIARLSQVLDFRTGAAAWSDNPVLALCDYLTNAQRGMGLSYAQRILPALEKWTAAADDCDIPTVTVAQNGDLESDAAAAATSLSLTSADGLANGVVITLGSGNDLETVTVSAVSGATVTVSALAHAHRAGEYASWASAGGTTAPRYRCGGVYQHTSAPTDVLGPILNSFDGWLGQTYGGALTVYSGRYYAPTVTLNDDAVTGYNLPHGFESEDAVNTLVVSYSSPANDYSLVEAEPWSDEASVAVLGEKSASADLPWVQDHGQARRIAKRRMSRFQAAFRGTVTTNLLGMEALGERYVQLVISELGLNAPVEITRAEVDLMNLRLTFDFAAADPNIDEWTAAEEEGTAPPVTSPSYAGALALPTIASVTVVRTDVNADIQGVSLQVALAAALADDQTAALQWTAGGPWTEVDGLTIPSVPAQASVQVQAEIASGDGRYSGWSATFTVDTTVDATIPTNVKTALDTLTTAAATAEAAAATAQAAAVTAQEAADSANAGVTSLNGRVTTLENQQPQ